MSAKKEKTVFVQGAIPPEKVAQMITAHQSKQEIGAHSLFLGQVRADQIGERRVAAIEYTAYEEMAGPVLHEIREAAFAAFDLTCCHIYHSLGRVNAGEICFLVFTSSAHRKAATEGCQFLVEEIKAKVPVFGKEIFDDETHQWKVNV
ncbi:MAG: molybdenum cofactor biosynthesis protein MoaE [Bacteroidetes bacterium]|nr:MAG: molybdenum cofactor biosynthesis protein MoaE [Bacteroidota bacterium]